ncbi:MAG TPA: TolC family protein, partial [Gemmatimonadaceae bacterium]|nr:TolC family protein [Gemmatimonadaceae bacterium]
MFSHRFFTAAAAMAFAGASLGAQSATPITFDQAVRIALQQNATVRQAKNENALDAASVTQQKLQFAPSLSLSTSTGQSYGRAFSESDGRIVDQTTQSLNAGVSSSVTLFDGLKNVANLRGAKLTEQASTRELARTKQTVVFTVASNYLALVTQREQLRVQEQNLASLEAEQRQIDLLVKAGKRPISDQYQQQASVAAARATVVDARNALELAKVDLMQTLQLDASGEYDFVPPDVNDSAAVGRTYDLDSLVTRALAQRADLDAQESRLDAARAGVRAAEAGKWPTISLGAGYNSAFSSASDVAFADQLDQRRGGSISVGISVPLFDRGATSLAAQRAQIAQDNARIALQTERQSVSLQVRRAFLEQRAAQERLKAAQAQIAAAEQALNASQLRYGAGAATLVEVTQSRTARVQA